MQLIENSNLSHDMASFSFCCPYIPPEIPWECGSSIFPQNPQRPKPSTSKAIFGSVAYPASSDLGGLTGVSSVQNPFPRRTKQVNVESESRHNQATAILTKSSRPRFTIARYIFFILGKKIKIRQEKNIPVIWYLL